MRRRTTRKSGNQKRPKTKLGLPDLDHSKSAVLNSLRSPDRNEDTGTRLTSSFSGTAPSRACPSTRWWSPAIEFTLRIAALRPVRSTDGWRP
jgi:hypothetical protein